MSVFTDEDLKRFKGISMTQIKEGDIGFIFLSKEALLHRLEAAERLRDFVKHWKNCKGIDDTCVCGFSDAENAWLKSKGERA